MLYVGSRKNFMVKREKKIIFLPSVKKTLGKPPSLPSVFFYTRQTPLFAECFFLTLGKEGALPSVFYLTLGKAPICRVFFFCRVFLAWHSAKSLFAECLQKNTRQKNTLDNF